MHIHAPELVVGAASAYFIGFGAGFLFHPEFADRLGLSWIDPAGKTEVRCYYGALSWALAGYLLYLLNRSESIQALTLVFMLASGVFVTRVLGSTLDKAWREKYTRAAIPIEAAFVVVLGVVRFTDLGR